MNILITGAHGFVGRNLIAVLAPAHTIYALTSTGEPIDGVMRTFSWNDIHSLPQCDAIIHLAAIVHDTHKKVDDSRYYDVNVGLTQRIFDYFRNSSARTFIFFSSVAAVAPVVQDILVEEVTPAPSGAYGTSKLAAEQYITSHMPHDKNVFILRPSMIYGNGCKGNLRLLYNVIRRGIPYPLGAFDNSRTFTSIENVTFIVDLLLHSSAPGGVYNICDDESISTCTLVALIAQATGRKPRIWRINKKLITILAHLGGLLHLPLNPERLAKLTENYRVSNDKIKSALGITHMPVRTHAAIYSTIHSFINN